MWCLQTHVSLSMEFHAIRHTDGHMSIGADWELLDNMLIGDICSPEVTSHLTRSIFCGSICGRNLNGMIGCLPLAGGHYIRCDLTFVNLQNMSMQTT